MAEPQSRTQSDRPQMPREGAPQPDLNPMALFADYHKTVQRTEQMPQQFAPAQRLLSASNPGAELSAALTKMDNLQSASVTRRQDGQLQVNMHFGHASTLPAINARVRGFTPGPTTVAQDISFAMSHTPNGVLIQEMKGFQGYVTGPLGRDRNSSTNAMHIGRDCNGTPFVDVTSTVRMPLRNRTSTNRFGEQNFGADSPMRQLMHHPDVLGEATNALRLFQDKNEVYAGSLRKTGAGTEVSATAAKARDIELNQELNGAVKMTLQKLHLDPTVSGTITHDGKSAKIGDLKGLSVQVKTFLGEQTVIPKSFEIKNNDKGEPVVKLEVELNKTIVPIEIPVAKLKERAAAARK